MGHINPGLCCSIIIRLLESNRSFRNSLHLYQANIFGTYILFNFFFAKILVFIGLVSCHIHPDWRMAAAASTTTTNLYSSFTNEPPDTVASSWPSSISRTGPDPSVARNPFQPGRSLKSKEIFFVNRRHSRTFCNPGQRRRTFSLLQDLHSAGSTRSN